MLVGTGSLGATDDVLHVADLLGSGISQACSEKPSCRTTCRLAPAHRFARPSPIWILTAGVRHAAWLSAAVSPIGEFYRRKGQCQGVRSISTAACFACAIHGLSPQGDSRETLFALARSSNAGRRGWQHRISRAWPLVKIVEVQRWSPAIPQPSTRVLGASSRLPDNCILSAR